MTPEASAVPPRRLGRSVGAVVAGFLSVVVLSLATDQLLHILKVYPPWGEPMYSTGLLLLALAYRTVYGALGSTIAAWLAPSGPMRHALILGVVGVVVALAGAIATIPMNLGPAWYPIALVLVTLPAAWVGGALYRARNARP